jgi:hypothetical protein
MNVFQHNSNVLKLTFMMQGMVAEFHTLTPGCRNEFIDFQKAIVKIAVQPIIDMKTHWNMTLDLLERTYRSHVFTHLRFKNPKYPDHQPPFPTQNQWSIVKYVMDVLLPFQHWTLWLLKQHTVTLHYVITVYNNMFDHMDGVMQPLAKKKTQWKADLLFALKFVQQQHSKSYTEVTPMTDLLLRSAHILEPVQTM